MKFARTENANLNRYNTKFQFFNIWQDIGITIRITSLIVIVILRGPMIHTF